MNWTELQKYAALTDQEKFFKYASENNVKLSGSGDSDSYFSDVADSRESVLDNIMEYDFFDIARIEELFGKMLHNSNLKNTDILLRITSVAMQKNKPREILLRERMQVSQATPPATLPV